MSDEDYDDDGELEPQTSGVKALRKDRDDKATELRAAQEKIAKQEREIALYKAGLGDLGEVKIKGLLAAHEGDLTPDGLKATAVTLGWAEAEDPEADARVVAAAQGQKRIAEASSGAGPSQTSSTITGEDVASWPVDRQMRFLTEHPNEWESLKRGETVSGIAFT